MRVLRVGDQRDAGRPEARIVSRAGDLRAELGREFAVHGRDVDADLLEDAAVHDRHDAASARRAGVVGPLPRTANEAASRPLGERSVRRQVILQRFQFTTDLASNVRKPAFGAAHQIGKGLARLGVFSVL